jgi:hypothetical protein
MKRSSAIFLQVVIVIIGITALAFMLWEPHLEGRNMNATFFEIYFKDAFLAYAYIASIFFFVAIYKAFKLFGYIGRDEAFSQHSSKAVRTIKHSATILLAFVVAAEAYLFINRPEDDIAGGIFMGLLMIVVFGIIAIVARVFERRIKNALGKTI